MLGAAVGGRSDPAAFLLSETREVAYLLQKNRKTGENFESVHKVSMAFVAKK